MKALAALLATALLGGCASLVSPTRPTAASPGTASCARWFAQVDAAVDQAGVKTWQRSHEKAMSPWATSAMPTAALRHDRLHPTPPQNFS